MSVSSEMRSGLREIALASRVFLVVALLGLAIMIGLIAWQHGAFTKTITVSFFAGTADGMNTGMAVKLVGFKVGSVESIAINRDLRVDVSLRIDARYVPLIDKDATLRLTRESLIGGNVLEVRPGSGDRGPIVRGTVLRYEREPAIEAAVIALVDEIAPVVTDLRRITGYLAGPDGEFRQAIGNANRALAELVEVRADLKRLIAEVSETLRGGERRVGAVLDSTDALLRQARSSLAMLDGSLSKIDDALPGIASKMDQSLENLRVASEAAREIATGPLPALLRDTGVLVGAAGELASDANEIVRGARQSWPVNRFVPAQRQGLRLRLDSGGGLGAMPGEEVGEQ